MMTADTSIRNSLYQTIFTLTAALASVFNVLIFVSTIYRVQKLTPATFITFWLCCSDGLIAVTDFVISATTLSLKKMVDLEQISDSSFQVCHVHAFMKIFGGTSSLLLCFGLTIFRYVVIVRQENLSPNFAPTFVWMVYLSSGLVAGLPFLMNSPRTYVQHPSQTYCFTDWTKRDSKSLIMILVNFATLTPPLVFIAFAYYRIYEKVKTSVSEVKKSIAESTPYLRGKGTFTRVNDTIARLAGDGGKHFNDSQEYDLEYTEPTPSTNPRKSSATVIDLHCTCETNFSDDIKPTPVRTLSKAESANVSIVLKAENEQLSLLKQSFSIVLTFLIGWTPYLILMMYEAITGEFVPPVYDFVAVYFIVLNAVVNPVVVLMFNVELRESFLRLMRKFTLK